eukprot:UN22995
MTWKPFPSEPNKPIGRLTKYFMSICDLFHLWAIEHLRTCVLQNIPVDYY